MLIFLRHSNASQSVLNQRLLFFWKKWGFKNSNSSHKIRFFLSIKVKSYPLGWGTPISPNPMLQSLRKNEASISPNRFLPRLLTLRQRLQSFQIILCWELPFIQKYLSKNSGGSYLSDKYFLRFGIGSNLSEFLKFCGGSYLSEFQNERDANLSEFKKRSHFDLIFYILSSKNTVSNSNLLFPNLKMKEAPIFPSWNCLFFKCIK